MLCPEYRGIILRGQEPEGLSEDLINLEEPLVNSECSEEVSSDSYPATNVVSLWLQSDVKLFSKSPHL